MATGRFAPSPTGELHVGNLRTALLAWLFARSSGGGFLVRMEDLDPVTSQPEHEEGQLRDLAAIGLDWDGPVVRQSSRRARHEEVLAQLVGRGLTFPCYCSRREVREAAMAPHVMPGTYPGTCRDLTRAEHAAREAEGRPAALRLRATGGQVTIEDRLHGEVTRATDDVVIRRADGVPAYNLAVVVDDHDQGVEEVVRAADLLDATPTQAHLLDLLGLQRPTWTHVPLAVGPDGERLAKRHGAVTLADLAATGVDASAALGLIARSLHLADPGEVVTVDMVLGRFDPDGLALEPWVVNPPLR